MAQTVTKPTPIKRGSKVPKDETSAARFLRLGEPRMTRALGAIAAIGKLAAPSYEYSPAQVTEIENALMVAVADCIAAFRQPTKRGRQAWTFGADL